MLFTGKVKLEEVGADAIKVSWDPAALQIAGVHWIVIRALPKNKLLRTVGMKIRASVGKAVLTGNLRPSSTYAIRVADKRRRGFAYLLGEITTLSRR